MKHSGGRESFERLGIGIFFHTGIWNLGTRIFFQYRDWYPSTRDFHCMASLIKTPVRIFEEPNQLSFQGGSFLYPKLARRGMKTIFLIKIPYFREFSAQYARRLLILTTKKNFYSVICNHGMPNTRVSKCKCHYSKRYKKFQTQIKIF